MNRTAKIVTALLLVAVFGLLLTGCSFFEDTSFGRAISRPFRKHEITYQASTRFLYSTDG